jgi:hypothetical protein
MITAVGETLDLATFLSSESGFSPYTILGALLASGLWFYAGYQQFRRQEGRKGSAFFWQAVGVWILIAYCIGALAWRTWVGLLLAVAALSLEIWVMNRCWWSRKRP